MKFKTEKTITPFNRLKSLFLIPVVVMALSGGIIVLQFINSHRLMNQINEQVQKIKELTERAETLQSDLSMAQQELASLLTQDQVAKNKMLEENLKNIKKTYAKAVETYEELIKFKENTKSLGKLDDAYAKSLIYLSQENYASASANLDKLARDIETEKTNLAASFKIPENVPVSNAPPSSGYKRQTVSSDAGSFLIDIISADLNSTRVIVDTASDSDCHDNCPVLSLGEYASRSGAFAGINGSYFCPASYPSCAGKTNSFDTLLMNKKKTYFNSDNNVYSSVPAVIFSGSSARFVSKSQDWGRDTGVDAVLANQPLLVLGGNVAFGGDGDPKKGSTGPRSFVANKGSTAYIGVVHNATVAQAAIALKALGMENALNLDSGGSTALWQGGYKVGPGRNIPNVLLFVKK